MERFSSMLIDSHCGRRIFGFLIVVVVIGGCSDSKPADRSKPSLAPTGSSVDASVAGTFGLMDQPELALRPNSNQEAALLSAVDAAVQACMQSKGFEYSFPTASQYLEGIEVRAALGGEAFPRGDRRRLQQSRQLPDEGDPNGDYLQKLSEPARKQWNDALSGTGGTESVATPVGSISFPLDGCRADGFASVYSGATADTRAVLAAVPNLEPIAHAATLSRPEILEAQGGWSECMKSRGYNYQSFADATVGVLELVARKLSPDKLAQADFDCSTSTGLNVSYRSAFNDEFGKAIGGFSGQVDAALAVQREAILRLGVTG